MEIRLATTDDLDDLTRLFQANQETHRERAGGVMKPNYNFRKEVRLRLERHTSRYLVAYIGGTAVGIVAMHNPKWGKKDILHRIRRRFVAVPTGSFKTAPAATVTDLYVDPAFRRQGVARALINAAFEHLREAGIERVVAGTSTQNKASIGAFESCGFEIDHVRLSRRTSEQ